MGTWPDVSPPPVVNPVPVINNEPDESERDFPGVFAACTVMCAGASAGGEPERVSVMEEPCVNLSDFPLSVSHAELVAEQRSDPSIKELLETAVPVAEVKDKAHGYFLDNGLLVRKWVPCSEVGVENPIFQTVVPAKFRNLVLQLPHVHTRLLRLPHCTPYLLTIMYQATRYPAAYPLQSITTRSVVKILSQFISIFGIPRVVQSDQGSNFSANMFAQVYKALSVVSLSCTK